MPSTAPQVNPPLGKAPSYAPASQRELERGLLCCEEFGIELARGGDSDCFRWFLASLLFGARISEAAAKRTYAAVVRHGLATSSKIIDAGRDFLVNPKMRPGGYVRHDGRKPARILRDCEALLADYGGSLTLLHEASRDARDPEEGLGAFYGVGPVTTNIFLRELRPILVQGGPGPLPIVEEFALKPAIDLKRYNRKSLLFARAEAGLLKTCQRLRGARDEAGFLPSGNRRAT